jgi:hypothetical protein
MGNTDIGNVVITEIDGQLGSSISAATDLIAVAGCCSGGVNYRLTQYSSAAAVVAGEGYGPAVEYAAWHIEKTNKPVYFCKLPTATAGTNSAVKTADVTGTSVITLTGTGGPRDYYRGVFEVMTGGTIGTAGIVFRYSLDGGRNYSPRIALGTATSYAIPNTNVTLNFAAGTLVAEDVAYWTSTAPAWTSSDFDAMFDRFAERTTLFAALHVVGEFAKTDADLLETELDAYNLTEERPVFAFIATRFPHEPAEMLGSPDLTFADANPDTITRSAGSFVTDGFLEGMTILVTGSTSNDGYYTIDTGGVGALVLTLVAGDALVVEGPTSDITLTGVESEATYGTAERTEWDPDEHSRVCCSAGGCNIRSVLASHHANWEFRRHPAWCGAMRFMQYTIATSLAKVKNGPIADTSITDAAGLLVEHDSRATSGLASLNGSNGRFLTLRTYDRKSGVYIAVPSMLHAAGSDFSRVHLRAVMDRACSIARDTLTNELADDIVLNDDGTARETELVTIEKAVGQQLRRQLRLGSTDPAAPALASSAYLTLARDDALGTPGTPLTGTLRVVPLGYIEAISITIAFSNPIAE